MQQKKLAGRSFFSKLGLAGSGARKPRREFKGSALEPFFHVFLRLNGALIVQLNYHIKASVKLVTFDRENQIIPWQGVYFFTNTVLKKSQKHTVVIKNMIIKKSQKHTVNVIKNMINTIGKKIHTLVKENTPRRHKNKVRMWFHSKVHIFLQIVVFSSLLLCEYWQRGQTYAS